MNKEWSELNKRMQSQIKKRDTYEEGIDILLALLEDKSCYAYWQDKIHEMP